ncbi:FG-GAP repeat domain-containing protein [Streptomyces sp. NPDC049040]|uniref:FG-GAP repeat domain-containing protein n=1 Tax=Streptomyces sp. NPDC049040 TaxID=3365593 RepID=UPI00371BB83C
MPSQRRTALRAATTAALAGTLRLPSATASADTGSTTAPVAGTAAGDFMRNRLGRAVGVLVTAAVLTAGLAGVSPPAGAAAPAPTFGATVDVVAPGGRWAPYAYDNSEQAEGDVVYAFSAVQLTGPQAGAAGLPEGITVDYTGDCTPVAGYPAVFTCPVAQGGVRSSPSFAVAAGTPDLTTAYFGYAYVPSGGDLAAGVQTALAAGAHPAGDTYGTGKATVFSSEHAATNTVTFDTPDLPSGGSVRHTLHVHATDPGHLMLHFWQLDGQPRWRYADVLHFEDLSTSAGVMCNSSQMMMVVGGANLDCRIPAGEQTISYTLTAPAGLSGYQLAARTSYDVYTGSYGFGHEVAAQAPFDLKGDPLLLDHPLLTRDSSGKLSIYNPTGAYAPPGTIGGGWQTYNALTKLSPFSENLQYWDSVPSASQLKGRGDLVGRDSSGTLWYYHRQFDSRAPLANRTKVGGGWNIYTTLTGGGDLNRDGNADLLARDTAGVLWFYAGTGNPKAPFAPRTRIGGGWQIYGKLAGSADLTGDGIADLTARDSAGVLWLYAGTGNAKAPLKARTRICAGWSGYNQLSVAGDVNRDGKADLVARDAAGVLWLYAGTGKATTPFLNRTRIGGGWQVYNLIL